MSDCVNFFICNFQQNFGQVLSYRKHLRPSNEAYKHERKETEKKKREREMCSQNRFELNLSADAPIIIALCFHKSQAKSV